MGYGNMKIGKWFYMKMVFYISVMVVAGTMLYFYVQMYLNPTGIVCMAEPLIIIRNIEILLFSFMIGFSIKGLYKLVKLVW
jgi:hypothetical protein